MKNSLLFILLIGTWFSATGTLAQDQDTLRYTLETEIPYLDSTITPHTPYSRERCRLDIYYPENIENFPTIAWFHGGRLRAGNKSITDELKNEGVCVVAEI